MKIYLKKFQTFIKYIWLCIKFIWSCIKYIWLCIKYIWSWLDTELDFYAASLSFYTIFALVPLLLLVLSVIAILPNFENLYLEIKGLLLSNLVPTNEQVVSSYLDTFMHNSSKLGELGFVSIFITSIFFFKNFQYIATKIFHSHPRDFWNSLTVYWTLVTLMPIGIGLSMFLGEYVQNIISAETGLRIHANWLMLSPILIAGLVLFVIFKISANKPLNFWACFVSSALGASVWAILKSLFVTYVFYNQAYLTIYGSFSILLFFLLWIYISWMIILYSMKLCNILDELIIKKLKENQVD